MKKLAIILARGGSKRIPKKNIRPFLGKPVIAYSIEAAVTSGIFSEVMVSTDDTEIADIARQYGASVPFFRSAETASDTATTVDALLEVLARFETDGKSFEVGCCLYSAAPFITSERLQEGNRLLEQHTADSVIPVVRFSYPIWRGVKKEGDFLRMVYPEYVHSRSQDLPPVYHDTGQFYWFNTNSLKLHKSLFMPRTVPLELSELAVHDIDTPEDWQMAELKYRLQHQGETSNV